MRKDKPVLRMINKYNIAELSLVDRPVQTTAQGFGAVIPRHEATHDARYFRTENTDNYGERGPQTAADATAQFEQTQKTLAGGNLRAAEQQGIHKISNLVGEVYSKAYDPQEQTDVQRSWLYQ